MKNIAWKDYIAARNIRLQSIQDTRYKLQRWGIHDIDEVNDIWADEYELYTWANQRYI